ncbi:M23 family metallopeptidase [Streptomyces sp. UNOC14_S4]|uniref:M23 family metallopeptidase n=1 Tax=Streptomyces sp. UNOC14_S4 TaxID=2872340 RepID=UPI0023B0AC59|nr:M23 family metallopeptidase [Streptomyces sp. UNOC14_S4]MCC3772906.1 peptidoglycan DD-metalloendopeptidase family protein [Streptomyces sp. UNOC14_S4]
MGHQYRPLRISRRPFRIPRGRRRAVECALCVLCALCAVLCPPFGSGLSAAVRAPGRAARVTSDVLRLTEEAGRTKERYERALRAAREQKARVDEITRRQHSRKVVSAALRDDAGAAARAQYRTGGFTVEEGAEDVEDPIELLEMQAPAEHRRATLGRLLDEDVRNGRRLDAEERELVAARSELEKDRARLKDAQRSVTAHLAAARDRLNALSQEAVGSGRCEAPDIDGVEDERAAEEHQEWIRPVESYELSAGFGGTGANWANGHTGQDFAVPIGTPVRAVGDGTVVSAGCGGAYGISMVIQHEGGWYSQYAHLSAPLASPGQHVRGGQMIGLSGTTGNSTGPHLHFEIRTTPEYGSAVDPVEWLNARGVRL